MKLPIGPSDYYETFPSTDHQSGDIWSSLPTHGILVASHLPCVVITPACDLINRKVDTLTYLPIVPVSTYLSSRSHLVEIMRAIEGQLQAAGLPLPLRQDKMASLPQVEDLDAARELLESRSSGGCLNTREKSAAARAEAGLHGVIDLLRGADATVVFPKLKTLFGAKDLTETARRLVTNSLRIDIHFLPADEQPERWSIIREPSVVLFRYPMSVPLDILDLASSVTEESWPTEFVRLRAIYPCVDAFPGIRPMKVLRIRPRFLSDLLTRFTGLYGRIGSPDFSDGTIDRYVAQIGGEE